MEEFTNIDNCVSFTCSKMDISIELWRELDGVNIELLEIASNFNILHKTVFEIGSK